MAILKLYCVDNSVGDRLQSIFVTLNGQMAVKGGGGREISAKVKKTVTKIAKCFFFYIPQLKIGNY